MYVVMFSFKGFFDAHKLSDYKDSRSKTLSHRVLKRNINKYIKLFRDTWKLYKQTSYCILTKCKLYATNTFYLFVHIF